jgi:hypothetical protein
VLIIRFVPILPESQELFPAKQFPPDVRPEFLEDVIQNGGFHLPESARLSLKSLFQEAGTVTLEASTVTEAAPPPAPAKILPVISELVFTVTDTAASTFP